MNHFSLLIVQDTGSASTSIRDMAEELGHNCLIATNEEEMKTILNKQYVDVIILSELVNGKNSIQILNTIQAMTNDAPPVLMISEHPSTHYAVEFMRNGGVDYLEHPIMDPRILDLQLKMAIERHRRMDADERSRLESFKQTIIYAIGHELRTPLTLLKTSIDVLEKYGSRFDEDKLQQQYSVINEGIDRLQSLVDTITETIDAYREGESTGLSKVYVQELILDVINEENILNRVHEAGIKLATDLPSILPPARANYLKLKQVIARLLDNAIKFTEKGYVKIELIEINHKLYIFISDTGRGIPQKDLERVFEPYEKLDQSGNTPGIGLSLHLCKKLVEMMGGSIEMESAPNMGAQVRVTLNSWFSPI